MFSLKSLTILALTFGVAFAAPPAAEERSVLEQRAGDMSELWPVSPRLSSWTMSSLQTGHIGIALEPFRPQKLIKAITPDIVVAPDNRKSMHAHFPKGSLTYQDPIGGISFYGPGPADVDLTTAKEATFGYTVYFPDNWDFVKGGKLPGFYGGDTDSGSVSCSGGRKANDCFSVRLMWRKGGAGEIYAYVPPYTNSGFEENEVLCSVPPYSECNPDYGNSVGRGAFSFAAGKRTYVATRVKLNDAGKANGEFQLWADGQSVINVGGIKIRDSSAGKIRGIQFQTFFGGSDSSWASPKDQDLYFSDFTVAITETF